MADDKAKPADWIILAAYVALIYGTLSIAPSVSKFFLRLLKHNFGIFIDAVIILALLSVVMVFYKRLKSGSAVIYPVLAVILSLYAVMIFRWTKIPSEKLHLLEYGFLSYLVLRVMGGVRTRAVRYLYTILIVSAIGCGDELIQKCLPNRVCELKDMVLNVISGVLGLALIEVLSLPGHQSELREK